MGNCIRTLLGSLILWLVGAMPFFNDAWASPEESLNKLRNLYSAGENYFKNGQYENALESYVEALEPARELGNELDLAIILTLVVLSACNTGVGDVERGQGVFGLRRAFQMAGARSLLMSLWKVPDSETVDLMRRFYINLYSGKSKVDSLNMSIKDTMREIKKIRGTDHPFYWGGFILIGNPENN